MAKITILLPPQPRLERLVKAPAEVLQDVALDFAARLLAGYGRIS